MGLFGRKKVADALGVNASRISQMTTAGDIIPAIDDDDGLGRGWPGTYVEEVAGRRQKRQTSRSVYSIPVPQHPYETVGDTTLTDTTQRSIFVQLLDVTGDYIGLITSLQPITRHPKPMLDQVDTHHRELTYWQADDLISTIHSAAREFNVSPFDVAWVHLGDLYATEVVLTSEPADHLVPHRRNRFTVENGTEETTRIEQVPFSTLHAKLGAPVPVLAAPTLDAVEQWRQANRTPVDVDFDVDGHYNTVLAASLLADLVDKYGQNPHRYSDAKPELEDALRLAVSRLVDDLPWSCSGEIITPFFVEQNIDDVAPFTNFRQSAFAHHQDRISAKVIEDIRRTTSQRQAAVNLLGQLKYEKYGDYGTDPSPALSYALDKGITAIISLTREEWMDDLDGDRAQHPAFHSIRTVSLAQSRPTCAHSYTDRLTDPTATASPDYRLLKSLETQHASFETIVDTDILVDPDGNYVLKQTIAEYGDYADATPHDQLSIVVPTASLCTRDLSHLKAFDEIIVDADTQNGPVWLSIDGEIHVMPFGTATGQGFTHGYGGSGPRNLADALTAFLEWATGATITKSGRDKLSAIVVGSDQGRELRISRSQVIQPGAFTTA